ncbi:hypothetical protein E4U10_002720 [Claviceps purpurea]|nr:hypothetical protein E4U10_002720 [Claviceps purpurea]
MEKMDNLEMKMKVLMQSLHLPREEPLLVCAFVLAASYGLSLSLESATHHVLADVAAFLLSVTCPPPAQVPAPTTDDAHHHMLIVDEVETAESSRKAKHILYSPIVLSNEEACAVFDSEGAFQDIYRECQQAVE